MTSAQRLVRSSPWLADDMLRVEQLMMERAGASSHPLVSEACLHLINAGGKRVRPALVMLTARAGADGRRAAELSAAAVELVHLATLYHDDVIDETETRRGVPTAHNKWGIEVAVLAGDYLFAAGCGLGADAGGEVPGILARAIGSVCEGQIVETASLNDAGRRVEDYVHTIGLKTAALFEASCELGASTSGSDQEMRYRLASYGRNLGLAFQVVDDLLDLVGDRATIGKSPGTDLKEGVFTAPVLIAAERDVGFAERLSDGSRDVDDVMPVLRSTGALDDTMTMAARYGRAAIADIDGLPETDWSRSLEQMIHTVIAQVPSAPKL